MSDLEREELLADAAALAQAVEDLAADIDADIQSLGDSGVASNAAAVGTYSYDDLDIVDKSLGPDITNKWCNDFLTTVATAADQAAFKEELALGMSLVLTIPAGAVAFSAEDIKCLPVTPQQTGPDQPAYFHIRDMKITALYTLFASGASYVDVSSVENLDASKQKSEAAADLSIEQVLYGLRTALRVVFLSNIGEKMGLSGVAD